MPAHSGEPDDGYENGSGSWRIDEMGQQEDGKKGTRRSDGLTPSSCTRRVEAKGRREAGGR